MNIQTIQNGADLVLLYQPLNLYLKPQARITITITLPSNVSSANKAISNFDVMDKLRQLILPDTFSILKVSVLRDITGFFNSTFTIDSFRCQRRLWSFCDSTRNLRIATSWRTSSRDWTDEKSNWRVFLTMLKWRRSKRNAILRRATTGTASSAMPKTWTRWRLVSVLTLFTSRICPSSGFARDIMRTTLTLSRARVFSKGFSRSLARFALPTSQYVIRIGIKWNRG